MRNELLTPNRSLTLGSVEKKKKKKKVRNVVHLVRFMAPIIFLGEIIQVLMGQVTLLYVLKLTTQYLIKSLHLFSPKHGL